MTHGQSDSLTEVKNGWGSLQNKPSEEAKIMWLSYML